MKISFYFVLLIFVLSENIFANQNIYSISICTTKYQEGANRCVENILKYDHKKAFIEKEPTDNFYRTFIGKYSSYTEAKIEMEKLSIFTKNQKPFIKLLNYNYPIKVHKKNQIEDSFYSENDYLNELKVLNSINYSKKNRTNHMKIKTYLLKDDFEKLIIEVNSKNNMLFFKGLKNNQIKNIDSFKVSTARANIKKPLGEGIVTSISLNPSWYPTEKTLEYFKTKGIDLPKIVPYGHKLNYMGLAKINLSHKIDDKDIYRIHGTLNESTIGTYESSGCIRMKNNEVFELASYLSEFIASGKNFEDIKVILN